jgi:DNA-directed RNA polymerase subunit RPC12/RpoP
MWKVLSSSEMPNDDSSSEEEKPVLTVELRCADCGYSTTITYCAGWKIPDGLDGTCPNCGSTRTTEVTPVCTVELRCADCGYSKRITHWFEWEIHDGLEGTCPHCRSKRTTVAKVPERLFAHAVPSLRKKTPPDDPYKHIVLSGPKFPDLPKKDLLEPHRRKQICRECNRQFVPGANHVGYINVCPECRHRMAFEQVHRTTPGTPT